MPRPAADPLRFYLRSLSLALAARTRTWAHRQQRYRIGRYPVTLPPAHRLPWFQALFPCYDRYAAALLRELVSGARAPLLVDIGANVGDTTLLALDAVPGLEVLAVEGDPEFVRYLRDNTAQVQDQVTVVDQFLAIHRAGRLRYRGNSSTGGFVPADDDAVAPPSPAPTVTAAELLEGTGRHDLVVWKSDTDGLDLSLLRQDWHLILSRCDVLWFEWDPFLDLEGHDLLHWTAQAIAETDRIVLVYDNFGRRVLSVPASAAADVLLGLTAWLEAPSVPGETSYFDVWLVVPRLASRAAVSTPRDAGLRRPQR